LLAKQFDTLNEQGTFANIQIMPRSTIQAPSGGLTQDVEPMDTTEIENQQANKAIWDRRTSKMQIISLPVAPYFGIVGKMGMTLFDPADFPKIAKDNFMDNPSFELSSRLPSAKPEGIAQSDDKTTFANTAIMSRGTTQGSTGSTGSTGSPSHDPSWWSSLWSSLFEHKEYDNSETGEKYMTDNYKSKLLEKYQILKEQQGGDQYVSNEFGDVTTRNQQSRNAGKNPIDRDQDQARVAQTYGVGTAIAAGYQAGIEPGRNQIDAQLAELEKQQKIATQPIDDRQASADALRTNSDQRYERDNQVIGPKGETRRELDQARQRAADERVWHIRHNEDGTLKVPNVFRPSVSGSFGSCKTQSCIDARARYDADDRARFDQGQARRAQEALVRRARLASDQEFLAKNPGYAQIRKQEGVNQRNQDRADYHARDDARRDARQQQRDRIVEPFEAQRRRFKADWWEAPARDATPQKPADIDFVGPPRYFHDPDGGVRPAFGDGSASSPITLGPNELGRLPDGTVVGGPGPNAPDNEFIRYDPTLNAQGKPINPPQTFQIPIGIARPPAPRRQRVSIPGGIVRNTRSNPRSNPNNTPYSPRRETLMASMDYFSQKLKNKYNLIREEIVNPKNAGTMSKGEIASRDRLATKVKAKPIKGKDTEKNAKYRLATFITLRNRKGN